MITTVGMLSTLKIIEDVNVNPLVIQGYSLINLLGALRYPSVTDPNVIDDIAAAGFPETGVFNNVIYAGPGLTFVTTDKKYISVRPLSARRWIIADSMWVPLMSSPQNVIREVSDNLRIDSISVGCTDDSIFGGVSGSMLLPFSPVELISSPNGGLISNSSRSTFVSAIPRQLVNAGRLVLNGGNVIHNAAEIAPSTNSIHPIVSLGSLFGAVGWGNAPFVPIRGVSKRLASVSCTEFFTVDISGDQDIFLKTNPIRAYLITAIPATTSATSDPQFKCGRGRYENCSFYLPDKHTAMAISLAGLSTTPRYVSAQAIIKCSFADPSDQVYVISAILETVMFAVQGDFRANYIPAY